MSEEPNSSVVALPVFAMLWRGSWLSQWLHEVRSKRLLEAHELASELKLRNAYTDAELSGIDSALKEYSRRKRRWRDERTHRANGQPSIR